MEMRLYAIKNLTTGMVKIGRSSNPEDRVRQITGVAAMCGFDHEFQLLGSVPIGLKIFETLVHRALSGSRHRNEWFHHDDVVQEFIETVITMRRRRPHTWLIDRGILGWPFD